MQEHQQQRSQHRQPKPARFSEMRVSEFHGANVECRMSNDERNPNDEVRTESVGGPFRVSGSGFLSSFVIGISSFIRVHGTLRNRVLASSSSIASKPKAASKGHWNSGRYVVKRRSLTSVFSSRSISL